MRVALDTSIGGVWRGDSVQFSYTSPLKCLIGSARAAVCIYISQVLALCLSVHSEI